MHFNETTNCWDHYPTCHSLKKNLVSLPAKEEEAVGWHRATEARKKLLAGKLVSSIQLPPTEAQKRKQYPLVTGCLDYFPDALMEVAHCSWVGNEQHNPGQPLHWDRSKSGDEVDALGRHLKDRGTLDSDGVRHSAKVAWRALANLQKEIEAERKEKVA